MSHFYLFDTLSLHAGQTVDPEFGARAAQNWAKEDTTRGIASEVGAEALSGLQ